MSDRMPLGQSQAAPCSQLLCARRAFEDAGAGHAKESVRRKQWTILGRSEQGACKLKTRRHRGRGEDHDFRSLRSYGSLPFQEIWWWLGGHQQSG